MVEATELLTREESFSFDLSQDETRDKEAESFVEATEGGGEDSSGRCFLPIMSLSMLDSFSWRLEERRTC